MYYICIIFEFESIIKYSNAQSDDKPYDGDIGECPPPNE